MSERERLFHKYDVFRTDGKPVVWAFVLEDKDPLAVPALAAYAEAAEQAGYAALADDLRTKVAALSTPTEETPSESKSQIRRKALQRGEDWPEGETL